MVGKGLTVRAYTYQPHKRANIKGAQMLTRITTVTFIFYTMYLSAQFNYFNHALWVAIWWEASGASEATPAVAEASKATYSS